MAPRCDATCSPYRTDGPHDGPGPVTTGLGWVSRIQSNGVHIKHIDISDSHIRIVDIKRTKIYGAHLR